MSISAEDSVVIKNIYYMLAYAFNTLDMGEYAKLGVERFNNVADLLAAILTIGIYSQRRRGIEHDYQETSDYLTGIRGRVDVWETVRQRKGGRLNARCTFDEYTADTSMNRILKTAALALLRSPELSRKRGMRLRQAALFLGDVSTIPDPRRITWRRLRFHRNTASYRMLMSVCKMVLDGCLLTTAAGEHQLAEFQDGQALHMLYEHFVLAWFNKHHGELRPSAKVLDEPAGAPSFLPRLQTDITLLGPRSTLIIDAKCYGRILDTHFDKEILSPANRHQIVDYVVHEAYGNDRPVSGMLLYALTEREATRRERWSEVGHDFYLWTLNLGQEFAGIEAELEEIAALLDT